MSTPDITCYTGPMGRWLPGAQERLVDAAMALYALRGFDQTTVVEIAKRAGLTERTFFRYFADKREVLFAGSEAFAETVVRALGTAPTSLSALDAVNAALEPLSNFFTDERRDFARRRNAIIVGNADLLERERLKLSALAEALAAGLRERGVADSTARLAADAGVSVFRLAFERWIGADEDFVNALRGSMDDLKALTA